MSPSNLIPSETCIDHLKPKPVLVTSSTTESGKVRVLTLSRPNALNAVSREMASQLFAALRQAAADKQIRVVILTGSGRAFSAGADIKELQHLTVESAFEQDWLAQWNTAIMSFRKPLIGAINGYAFGGGAEIAMMCDILHCGKSMKFGLPEITLGTIPGAGGTQRLVQAIGKSRAFEMVLTGERLGADEALQRGLVSRVFADDKLVEECVAFAEKVALQSSTALQMAKEAMNATQKSIMDGLELEKKLYHMSFGTECFREGVAAFVEKRPPQF